MSYRYKTARLVYPPARAPLPSGSVYYSAPYACADFENDQGQILSLSFNELRDILVHKINTPPAISTPDLKQAFRETIRITPHTHSNVSAHDIAAAYSKDPTPP